MGSGNTVPFTAVFYILQKIEEERRNFIQSEKNKIKENGTVDNDLIKINDEIAEWFFWESGKYDLEFKIRYNKKKTPLEFKHSFEIEKNDETRLRENIKTLVEGIKNNKDFRVADIKNKELFTDIRIDSTIINVNYEN